MIKKMHSNIGISIITLLVFLAGLHPLYSYSASIDPSFKFSTIKTDHFAIHYHQGLESSAYRSAEILENFHDTVSVHFRWSPDERTQVVLLDNTDFANGLATVLPYNAIFINVVPPFPDLTISESDDWLELVLVHEYAHILTLDPVRGFSSHLRSIFGKTFPGTDPLSMVLFLVTAPPNIFLPGWWTEGIATWAETEYTSSGRGRSSFVDMILRMAVFENELPRVDLINGDVPYWPSGSIRYIYGMLVEKYIADMYGQETLGELSLAHSGRLPFFINSPPIKMTGLNYIDLYREVVKGLMTDQVQNIEHLKTLAFTDVITLPVNGERMTNPRVSPRGRYLAVNRRDPHDHEAIIIYDLKTFDEMFTIKRLPSDHSLTWSSDGQRLFFTQALKKDSFNQYQDIFVFNLETDSVKQVTKNIRAKGIDVLPDGSRIVFVKTETGRQNISVLTLENGKTDNITDFNGPVLSSPRWSPDGTSIVYSKRDVAGRTSIEIIDVETGNIETLLKNNSNNVFPTWSDDGRHIIYSSDSTGVYNLHAYSLSDKKIRQVTHVPGGAFHAEITENRIYFSNYSSKGFDIVEISYMPSFWRTDIGPFIKKSWDERKESDRRDESKEQPLASHYKINKYNPTGTLRPRFWLPTISYDDDGVIPGVFTAGHDVLGYHTYTISAGHGVSGRTYFNINYLYDRWKPSFLLRAFSLPVYYADLFADGSGYYERSSGASLEMRYPLPMRTLESYYSGRVGLNIENVNNLTEIRGRKVGKYEIFEGRKDHIFAGFTYRGALRYPLSISFEDGREITFLLKNYIRGLDHREYLLDYKEYIGHSTNHAIFLNLSGAVSEGEHSAQQSFRIGGVPYVQNRFPIRGFPSNFKRGKYVVKSSLEYRFPLWYIFRGWNTKPVFLDRLHMALFTDAGHTWGIFNNFAVSDVSVGIGAEARMDTVIGYKARITPSIGFAQGITDRGETQIYFIVYIDI